MSRGEFLSALLAVFFIARLCSINGMVAFADLPEKGKNKLIAKAGEVEPQDFPTRENPVVVDEKAKKVLVYTEVHGKNVNQWNAHWGVVYKEGKLEDRAILRSYASPSDFHTALVKIGARPGNNLNKDTNDQYVEGDSLDVKAIWRGLGKELPLNEIFVDEKGKNFNIKFGGNRKASEEQKTGCITCLESCWISISSNANYPQTGSIKRFLNPNSHFKGRADVLPGDEKPVILIYRVASAK